MLFANISKLFNKSRYFCINIKDETLTALNTLKGFGLTWPEVEQEIGLKVNSIDQALSRGGNLSLLNRLKTLIEAKTNAGGQTVVELNKAIGDFLHPMFVDKAERLNQLGLLQIKTPDAVSGGGLLSTGEQTAGQLLDFLFMAV